MPEAQTPLMTRALTGGPHGKEANPNLPEQLDEIVAQGSPPGVRARRAPRARPESRWHEHDEYRHRW